MTNEKGPNNRREHILCISLIMGDTMEKLNYRQVSITTLQNVKNILLDNSFRERAKSSLNCFTRERKMGFVSIFKFLLNLPRRPLPVELDDFCGESKITKQAFSKARQNIKSEAFREIAVVSAQTVMTETKGCDDFRGLRVFAVDGSELEIPQTPENIAYFGAHGSETACRARVSALLHISSRIIADAEITPLSIDERTLAERHIERMKDVFNERDLLIADRGYPSRKLIKTLEDANIKYLMRVQRSCTKEIDENPCSDFRFIWRYKKHQLNIRVVRVVLDTGETENLITNLPESEFETACFKELYFLRWGIESKYSTLKSKFLVEHFSGKSRLAVEQDFYATICAANLTALTKGAADEQIAEENVGKSLKHEYQTNEKLAIKKVKNQLLIIMNEDDPVVCGQMFDALVNDIARHRSEIRPGRHYPRPKDCHHRRKHRLKAVL